MQFGGFLVPAVMASIGCVGVPAWAGTLLDTTHHYAFGASPDAVDIRVQVFDNYLGDFSKYLWQYTVTNKTFDPNPGTSNGFSGFETALPANVPDLGDQFAPSPAWIDNGFSGQPVEWDLVNDDGLGIMPGQTGVFGFTSAPRLIVNSTGWFHTWQDGGQTDVTFYADTPGELGPEVPDVLGPIQPVVPLPSTLLSGMAILGLLGGSRVMRHRHAATVR